jgi:hypothetical protein
MQYLASGCQSGILGLEVYDTPETKAMVSQCFDWFREYRDILTSEIIHISRPNGRDLDCMFHVNPGIRHKGMVVVFNPTEAAIEKSIRIPVYYTGLRNQGTVKHEGKAPVSLNVNEKQEVLLTVSTAAHGVTWYLME